MEECRTSGEGKGGEGGRGGRGGRGEERGGESKEASSDPPDLLHPHCSPFPLYLLYPHSSNPQSFQSELNFSGKKDQERRMSGTLYGSQVKMMILVELTLMAM